MALWKEAKRSVTDDECPLGFTGVNCDCQLCPAFNTNIVEPESIVSPLSHFNSGLVKPGRNNGFKDGGQRKL